jgi:ADP-ribose pyrophosphatase
MVIPVTPSGRLLLIRVHRYPAQKFMWELPAGLVDPGENPEAASLRELKEETGVDAISATYLGAQTPISGLVGDKFHSILAEIPEVELDDLVLQSEEGIVEAKLVSRTEIASMIVNQEIEDGVTLYSLARYWAYLEAEGN